MPKELSDFNHRQQVFLASLLKYRAKGDKGAVAKATDDSGYNATYCREFLTKTDTKEFLNAQTAETVQKILNEQKMTIEQIIEGYKRIANFDPSKQYKLNPETGKLERLHVVEQDKDTRMCDGATLKDVKGALDSLSRINALFTDNVSVGVTFKDILDDVSKNGSDDSLVNDA